jgi:PAS domain S-box-containing protein
MASKKIKALNQNSTYESRYHLLTENLTDIISTHDKEGNYTYVTPNCFEKLGYTSEELLGTQGYSYIYPEDIAHLEQQHKKILSTQKPTIAEFRFRKKDGTYLWMEVNAHFATEPATKTVQLVLVSRDISKNKKKEEELNKSIHELSEYKYALNQSSTVEVCDTEGKIIFANENFCRLSGYSREELIGSDHRIMNSGYHPKKVFEDLWTTILQGKVWRNEIRNKAKDGHFFWVSSVIVPFFNENHELYQFMIFREDITKRKETELALEELLQKLEEKVETRTRELSITNQTLNEEIRERITMGTILAEKSKEINDSINYAAIIQQTVLTPHSSAENCFYGAFVLNRPKNIVSGDFFWHYDVGNYHFLAVADCTGHGVPGAMLSLVAFNFFNEIIIEKKQYEPAAILMEMDKKFKNMLHRNTTQSLPDGMDVVLCRIDQSSNTISFAGAWRPLYYYNGVETLEISGTRDSIGGIISKTEKKEFTQKEIIFKVGDAIYLTSDGYESQFGGPNGKKIMKKRLKTLFSEIANLPIDLQMNKMNIYLDSWKESEEQVDDILVVGMLF